MIENASKIEEPNDETDPHSFRNVFKQVVACAREYKISASDIYHSLPAPVFAWCTRKEFSENFANASSGVALEGIMSKVVADGIFEAIGKINGSIQAAAIIKEPTRRRKWDPDPKNRWVPSLGPSRPVKDVSKKTTTQTFCLLPAFVSMANQRQNDNLLPIEKIRTTLQHIFEKTDLTPLQIYGALPEEHKTLPNLVQINGWLDGRVDQSPKELVVAFLTTALDLLEAQQAQVDQPKNANLLDIQKIYPNIQNIFEKTDVLKIYQAMPRQHKSPENLAQVNGWFNGTVAQSPKELVWAFLITAAHLLETQQAQVAQPSP